MKLLQHTTKHLKHLKCEFATCIISWCGLLRRLHRGATPVAAGEAGGLPALGPSASPCADGPCRRRRAERVKEQEQWQEQ